jgi:hypothetical protein
MSDTLEVFLAKHPTAARWLDDIIDVLLEEPRGTAHVREIAKILNRQYGRDVDTVEETVTRRVNDFCSNATDFSKDKKFDLFERVEPATYRLRSFPDKPDVIELIAISFDEAALQSVWNTFKDLAAKQLGEKWKSTSNRKKLEAFAKNLEPGKALAEEYERRKEFYSAQPRIEKI